MILPGKCKMLQFDNWADKSGGLGVIEKIVPFVIKRIYFLYDQKNTRIRGLHAHKRLQQVIFAVNGSFDLLIDDGKSRSSINLGDPLRGIYISPGIWRELSNFSAGSVCLVLASEEYDETDYIKSYEEFLGEYKSE